MGEIEDVLQRAIKALNRASIRYVVVGGLAAILRGSPRTTSDIDVIIHYDPRNRDKLIESFRSEGFDVMESQMSAAFKEGSNFSIFAQNSIIRIDMKAARKPDEYEVLQQAVEMRFKENRLLMASIEQILYGKVLYLGDISDLSDGELLDFNDARDFVNVFRTASTVNMEWLTKKVEAVGLSKTLQRLLAKVKDLSIK